MAGTYSTRRSKNSLSLLRRLRPNALSFKSVLHTEMSAMEAARKDALEELQELSDRTRRLEPSFVEQVRFFFCCKLYLVPH